MCKAVLSSVRSLVWVVLVGLSSLCALRAQAGDLPVFGLEELIQMALANSPEIRETEQELAAAESDLAAASAARWARLDAAATGGVVDDAEKPVVRISRKTRRRSGTWVVPIQEGLRESDAGLGPWGRLTIQIFQPLYTFGKISNQIRAASHGVQIQHVALETRKGQIIRRVKELYYAYVLADQGEAAAEETDSFFEDLQKRIQKLIDLGSPNAGPSDLYRLETYRAETQRFRAKAKTGSHLAYLALKATVGFPPDRDFRVDREELPEDPRTLGDESEYIRKALKYRPELEQLNLALASKEYQEKAARAELYPTFFVSGIVDLAGAPGREHLDEPYIGDDFNSADVGGFLGASWSFDLGVRRAEIRRKRAEHQRLLHTREIAKRDIPLEVARNYQKVLEFRSNYQASKKAATAARKWIVAAFSNFDMGLGTAKDVLDAIERYGTHQGDYLESLFQYYVALAELSLSSAEYRIPGEAPGGGGEG